ncbi:MAG: glycosyltransferase family 4 protein [Candidatus Kerfeldbacteria bacterium]|nr:glycosyltransferase family 4 protein [Candidatus Kerfeldbacteria bacterium]
MRIVYLLSYFELVGGQEFFLARQQAKQGHEVFVVGSDLFYPVPRIRERYLMDGFGQEWLKRRPGRSKYEGLTIIRLPTVFHYQDFILVRGVKEVLVELRPDVVFGHEPRTIVPILGARYKQQFGYLYYLDSHDFFHTIQNHQWWQRWLRYAEYFWWRRWFVDYGLRQADRIIAVAEECRKFLVKRHGVPNDRIDYLPLGVETDFFQYDETARREIRQKLGGGSRDIILIFAGYMFRRKALESLIDLIAQVRDISLRLVFAGEGPADYLDELKSYAQKKGVAERVHFTGFLSRQEVTRYYAAADIGIWPGNNSLVIMEAMACRLPIIMADMQLAHLVSHGNGFKVPYADVGLMKEVIKKLATNPELRREMGLASEKASLEHYSYASLARQVSSWMEADLAKLKR